MRAGEIKDHEEVKLDGMVDALINGKPKSLDGKAHVKNGRFRRSYVPTPGIAIINSERS